MPAASERRDDVDAEHFGQGAGRGVPVHIRNRVMGCCCNVLVFGVGDSEVVGAVHRIPPVPPNRSVFIDSGE